LLLLLHNCLLLLHVHLLGWLLLTLLLLMLLLHVLFPLMVVGNHMWHVRLHHLVVGFRL